jgi:uncharacterized protein
MSGSVTGSDTAILPAAVSAHGATRRPEARAMTESEIDAFLRGARWGVLATSGADGPYAVPVAFAWDDGVCYVASGPGLKADNIGRYPAVCLTVVEVAGPPARGWRSVVLRGSAQSVSGVVEKAQGFLALRRQFDRDARPTARDLRRYATAGLLRITPTETTGRSLEP